jgi:hypothetical protein
MLYKEGKPLKEITCPCGLGYWDIFQERFVSGDQIREGAPSRREYETKVKVNLKEGEFEARLREQWIHHFLSCKTKLAIDERAIREGRGDTSSRQKAEAELKEIARGDFKSRGRSQSVHERPLGPVQYDEGESRHRATSQATSREHSSWAAALRPNDSRLPTVAPSDTGQGTRSNIYTLFDRDRPADSVASRYEDDSSTWGARVRGPSTASPQYFLPNDGIREDVLDHHCRRNAFGAGATFQVASKVSINWYQTLEETY